MLWLEADRMKTLDFSSKNLENQCNVVEEEVRVNVLNQPYGLFYIFDLPKKAFDKYPNAHNAYGDFQDLNAANIDDVHRFYDQYYAPNNAVLAIVGDFSANEVLAKVEKYFANVPAKPTPPRPDVAELPQAAERRMTQEDKLAKVPALAIGYRMPPRTTHDAVVGAVTGELLHNGQASRLYQSLVKEKQVALSVSGGLNLNGAGPFEYDGPVLMISFIIYPGGKTQGQVLAAYDAAIAELSKKGPSPAELERIRSKMRADWYSNLELPFSRAQAFSHATLFDGTYERAYSVPEEVSKVTVDDVRTFTVKYLVKTNRTIINRVPKLADKPAAVEGAQ
jgi:zinc protease